MKGAQPSAGTRVILAPVSFVDVLRGGMVESRHRVHAAVVRPDGTLLASVGDPDFVTFLRSAAKPFQALPLAAVMDDLGLTSRHLAIACASHAGEDVHRETVLELMERGGVTPEMLACGTHLPFDAITREELRERGEKPSVLHHNCSGKHSGMIAAALKHGWLAAGYELATHPVQARISADLAALAGIPHVPAAVDGCSVPAFALSMRASALAFARLADPDEAPSELRAGLERVYAAMREHPYLVAGRGRLDTRLMIALPGLVSKIGAEAYHGMALCESQYGPLGVSIKVEDGGERARDAAAMRVLAQLGVVREDEEPLAALSRTTLRNHAGLEVGVLRAEFGLSFA